MIAISIIKEIKNTSSGNKKKVFARFFKTGKGEYAEGDLFLGLSVPSVREIAFEYKDMPLQEVGKLIKSKYHECRLSALMILIYKYRNSDNSGQKIIFNFYLKNTKYINNWDLVDLSAYHIVGDYLLYKNKKVLYKLAKSRNLWDRRISIVATYAFIKNKESFDIFKITELLIDDREDLIHKACGWMLREVGKKISERELTKFLDKNYRKMPRTMLRYAIEKLDENKRQYYLKK